MEYLIHQREPHAQQWRFIASPAPRKIIRAGRRSGKTTGLAYVAVEQFLAGKRVLYAAPTADQLGRFWFEVCESLRAPLAANVFYKNENEHIISIPHSEQRIRAKTAWNANTLRGDFADLLILDEYQLMNEDAWGVVGAPMLLDNNGTAVFIYTPPSLRSAGISRANDPRHAAKTFAAAQVDTTGRWAAFHFTSHDNPYISATALQDIVGDMTTLAYRQEIMAEDIEDAPGALWKRAWLDDARMLQAPDLARIVVAVDPSTTSGGDEWGIVAAGMAKVGNAKHFYVLEDASLQASPEQAARAVATLYHKLKADAVVAESNQGGEMVTLTLKTVDKALPVKLVHASRGKATRAEPISAIYEQGRGHHVGTFALLEDELCQWEQGNASPNRLDALVWAATELMLDDVPTPSSFITTDSGLDYYKPERSTVWQKTRVTKRR